MTFSVYSDQRGTEKIFPFCLVPRVIAAARLGAHRARPRAAAARARAVPRRRLRRAADPRASGVVPRELVLGAKQLRAAAARHPAAGRRAHPHRRHRSDPRSRRARCACSRTTCARRRACRTCSRTALVTKRVFPHALERARRAPRRPLPDAARRDAALGLAGRPRARRRSVVLTPGPFNSAYFEHSFLARTMGLELVEAPDLFVDGDKVFVRTTRGPAPRRRHLPPHRRRLPRSRGLPARQRARRARPHARLRRRATSRSPTRPATASPTTRRSTPFVPDMIRFYLGEEPILEQVPTYVCARDDDRALRARAPRRAGRQGRRRGGRLRHAHGPAVDRRRARASSAQRILAEPRRYIAQHRVELSTCPTWDRRARARVEPRRVDLRPFVLDARRDGGRWVLPGGLTRVALREGSYVVNSSQGGGSKDTWVQMEGPHDLPRRRSLLLVRALPRARREHRAPARRSRARWRSTPSCRRRQCWRPVVIVSGE